MELSPHDTGQPGGRREGQSNDRHPSSWARGLRTRLLGWRGRAEARPNALVPALTDVLRTRMLFLATPMLATLSLVLNIQRDVDDLF